MLDLLDLLRFVSHEPEARVNGRRNNDGKHQYRQEYPIGVLHESQYFPPEIKQCCHSRSPLQSSSFRFTNHDIFDEEIEQKIALVGSFVGYRNPHLFCFDSNGFYRNRRLYRIL